MKCLARWRVRVLESKRGGCCMHRWDRLCWVLPLWQIVVLVWVDGVQDATYYLATCIGGYTIVLHYRPVLSYRHWWLCVC